MEQLKSPTASNAPELIDVPGKSNNDWKHAKKSWRQLDDFITFSLFVKCFFLISNIYISWKKKNCIFQHLLQSRGSLQLLSLLRWLRRYDNFYEPTFKLFSIPASNGLYSHCCWGLGRIFWVGGGMEGQASSTDDYETIASTRTSSREDLHWQVSLSRIETLIIH